MALLACHTLRHSFNAREHARLQQRQAAVSLFVSSRPPAAQEAPQVPIDLLADQVLLLAAGRLLLQLVL